MAQAIKNRYDFVILFDVANANPNGDPHVAPYTHMTLQTTRDV